MTDTQKSILYLPLSRLEHSIDNVRKQPATKAQNAELEASIRAHGLLSPLLVCELDGGSYGVVAGSRRYDALCAIYAGEHDSTKVACSVVEKDDMLGLEEISLAENAARADMHPVDQFGAFKSLSSSGLTAEEIATRFGVSERTVLQRLRLAEVAPEVLDAYAEGNLTLQHVMAFTVTRDFDRQRQVLARSLSEGDEWGHELSPYTIREMLTKDSMRGDERLPKFVGVQNYIDAGGAFLQDMFYDSETYLDGVILKDVGLLERMATAKLSAAVKAEQDLMGWKWSAAQVNVDFNTLHTYGRLSHAPVEPTTEQANRMDEIRNAMATLEEVCTNGNPTPDQEAEYEAMCLSHDSLVDEIESNPPTYDADDIAIAGVIATVSAYGELEFFRGLVKQEDMPEEPEKEDVSDVRQPLTTNAPKSDPYSHNTSAELREIRSNILKSGVYCRKQKAVEILTFAMAVDVLDGHHDKPLDILVGKTGGTPATAMIGDTNPRGEAFSNADEGGNELNVISKLLSLDWLKEPDQVESFRKFQQLAQYEQEDILAYCVVHSMHTQLATDTDANPIIEAVADDLGIDWGSHTNKNEPEIFFEPLSKSQLIDIGRETLGEAWVKPRLKMKKADLVAEIAQAFGENRPEHVRREMGADAINAARAWSPEGFAPKS